MGDIITILGHLDLSPINTILLGVILWLIWRLFERINSLEDEIADHQVKLAVAHQRLKNLEAGGGRSKSLT